MTDLINGQISYVHVYRLSEQAQRHLQDSEKFEDILLGASRPTMVIQRYDELFSQGRMDALDAIEQIQDQLKTRDGGVFGIHLVLDVFKVSLFVIFPFRITTVMVVTEVLGYFPFRMTIEIVVIALLEIFHFSV